MYRLNAVHIAHGRRCNDTHVSHPSLDLAGGWANETFINGHKQHADFFHDILIRIVVSDIGQLKRQNNVTHEHQSSKI